MKNKLLQHEILLVVLLAAMQILKTIISTDLTMAANVSHGLFPRLGVILLFLSVYFWVNLVSIPRFMRTKEKGYLEGLLLFLQFLTLSFLLALGVNLATYFANPANYNYAGYGLFSWLGYNDRPLKSIWMGWDRGLMLLAVYGSYAAFRTFLICKIEDSGSKKRYFTLISNQISGFLVIYLLFPTLLWSFNLIENDAFYSAYFMVATAMVLVYVGSTCWLFPSYLKNEEWSFPFLMRTILFTLICSFPVLALLSHTDSFLMLWLENWGVQLLFTVPVSWLIYRQGNDQLQELRNALSELTRSKSDLQFLRMQINPHFLFNALNTLYGTALLDGSKRTANGIQLLGDMMRFMLEDNHQDFIPMKNEITYLQNFIELQKLRLRPEDQLQVKANLDFTHCDHLIVPMLLIPFVENAFKHGFGAEGKFWVNIELSCTADEICFKVRNSLSKVVGFDLERQSPELGLNSLRERLKLFYDGRHQLNYGVVENEFIAELTIQIL
ncbi:sensor histidine kinase [Pedobacter gandavensis]|uniref:sensor histidine kinase n=1 Tax=Pedobacter gandavensis TaxID=2679963 RepID=UPI00292DFBD8|nr:histidine kinase [Pedobacter gandavensis]